MHYGVWKMALFGLAAISGCVHSPETLNVRVRNHAAHNLTVKCVSGGSAGREELVYPGAFSQSHASEVIVRAPGASIRIVATPAIVAGGDGERYRYAHITLQSIGRREVIFEVMVDNENQTWAYAHGGERVRFPSERMGDHE